MGKSSNVQNRGSPEQWVGRLVAQLRNHALWDSLLIFSPPLLVSIYLLVSLYRAAWIAPPTFLFLGVAFIVVVLFAVVARYRPLIPSVHFAARLVDERTGAQDRFLTLSTIEAEICPPSFLTRLRGEAAALLERIDLRREFPYHIKRSFYWSLATSLIVAALFHLSMSLTPAILRSTPPYEKVRELAEKIAKQPRLSTLAYDLRTLATKLQQPDVSEQEKQISIRENLKQIERQQKQEKEKESRDLLGEASSTLQSLERDGSSQQQDSGQGGDGVQSNQSQEGQGQSNPTQGTGSDSRGDLSAQQSKDMQRGKTSVGDPKQQGKEKSEQSQAEGKGNQPDPKKSDKNTGAELTGKTEGGAPEKLGKSRSEEIPQGAPPAERFYKPGEEGKDGVKGARYVTVQLPEELAADAKGETTTSKQSKDPKPYPKAPVSNVPLPAHVPDAPTEKQQLPLEYRGIIR
jgi:hypothetical protein